MILKCFQVEDLGYLNFQEPRDLVSRPPRSKWAASESRPRRPRLPRAPAAPRSPPVAQWAGRPRAAHPPAFRGEQKSGFLFKTKNKKLSVLQRRQVTQSRFVLLLNDIGGRAVRAEPRSAGGTGEAMRQVPVTEPGAHGRSSPKQEPEADVVGGRAPSARAGASGNPPAAAACPEPHGQWLAQEEKRAHGADPQLLLRARLRNPPGGCTGRRERERGRASIPCGRWP